MLFRSEEIEKIDEKIGYIIPYYVEEKNGRRKRYNGYDDIFIENLKMYSRKNSYLIELGYDTDFFKDITNYKVGDLTIEEYLNTKEFSGIDSSHVYDAFIKYEFAIDFKYIEAENVSFQIVKDVFSDKKNTLYFIKLPNGFFRLRTNVTKMLNIIEPKTLNHFVFLVPYSELISRDIKVKELKNAGVMIGVYHLNTLEQKSIKLNSSLSK